LLGLVLLLAGLPVYAQQPADVVLVNALPEVSVDVSIDGGVFADGLAFGESVGSDMLMLQAGQSVDVQVREASTGAILVGPGSSLVVPERGALVVHYDVDDVVAVSVHSSMVRSIPVGWAAAELAVFANAPEVDFTVNQSVATPTWVSAGPVSLRPGRYEIVAWEAETAVGGGHEGLLAGPAYVELSPGDVAAVFVVGSGNLGNLQLLTLGYQIELTEAGPGAKPGSGTRPAGQLPDVEVLNAIPEITVDVQLGDGGVQTLAFGDQVNDDVFGRGASETVAITVTYGEDVLVGPVEVPITSDAGSLVIHRDPAGAPRVSYFPDPVEPLCEGEGGLVLRNTAVSLIANWAIGRGPVADDEMGSFEVLFWTPDVVNGQEFRRAVPAGEYVMRAFNYINGEPASTNEDLTIRDGQVTVVYLVGANWWNPLPAAPPGVPGEDVALAALLSADRVPPAPPGTEVVAAPEPVVASPVTAPTVQYESCSPYIVTGDPIPAEADAVAGVIGGFVTGVGQVDQYVTVYKDVAAAEAALARHRALAEDCDAALAQRLTSGGSAEATLYEAPPSVDGYRVRVVFDSEDQPSDEESAVYRYGQVLSFVKAIECCAPEGSGWELDHAFDGMLDPEWAETVMQDAAALLPHAMLPTPVDMHLVDYDVASTPCGTPPTSPGPVPSPTAAPVPSSVPTGASPFSGTLLPR
jgi:hypothetical protein